MSYKQLLKNFLFPTANILIGIFLVGFFFTTVYNIIKIVPTADRAVLNNLKPIPFNYFWKINILHETIDKDQIFVYTDYFEHFLKTYPTLNDLYGVLGVSYHYLENDKKASQFLKTAIQENPYYFWHYYNLAMLDIAAHQYKEAGELLETALKLNPATTLITIEKSENVYLPLVQASADGSPPTTDPIKQKELFMILTEHLRQAHQQAFSLMTILGLALKEKKEDLVFKNFKPELYAF